MYLGWTIGLLVIIFIFLLVAQATEMTNLFCKYNTGAYLLDTWTLLYVGSHHIYCMCPVLCTQDHFFYFLVTFLYYCTCWLLASTWSFSFLVRLTGWYLCVLMSQEINMKHLWVSGNLLHVFCSCLWTLHLFGKLSYCTGWKFVQFHMALI